MAGRDNVLYHARLKSTTAENSIIPLSLLTGVENVRQGYGSPKLKSVRAFYSKASTDTNVMSAGIPIEIKNSNWVDSAGLVAGSFDEPTCLSSHTLGYMRGRDKALVPNTSWIINATMPNSWTYSETTAPYFDIYVLIEIEYSDVQGIDTENTIGSPVMKHANVLSVTGPANVPFNVGTFDNLLQGIQYVLSEVSITAGNKGAQFMILEGFANQKGLTRIIPVKGSDTAIQIAGSVYLTKQTYNLSIITNVALDNEPVQFNLELIASAN